MKTRIIIPRLVYQKIMHWVNNSDDCECSGMASVEIKDGEFHLIDAFMVKQENGSAETEMDQGAVGKLMYEHQKQKKPGELKCWWHSHVDMAVFWSSTDREQIEKNGEHGWYSAIVFNKKREMLACVYQGAPIPIFMDQMPVVITDPATDHLTARWNKEYADTVTIKERTWEKVGGYMGGYNGNGNYEYDWNKDATEKQPAIVQGKDSKPPKRLVDMRQGLAMEVPLEDFNPFTADEAERYNELQLKDYHSMTADEWTEWQELNEMMEDERSEWIENYYERKYAGAEEV